MEKKLTIITINYNNRDGLEKTIRSVIEQSARDKFEYVIIDGGSTDGSRDVIERYSNQIDYWVSEPDKGIYNAMNKGVQTAKGEYCLFLNSGDLLIKKNIYIKIEKYLFSNMDIYCGYIKVFKENKIIKVGYSPKSLTNIKLLMHHLPHQATIIRRTLLKNNPYSEDLKIVSDWKFLLEEIGIYQRSYQQIPMVISLFDGNGISSINQNLFKEERKKVFLNLDPSFWIGLFSNVHVGLFEIASVTGFRSKFGDIVTPIIRFLLNGYRWISTQCYHDNRK